MHVLLDDSLNPFQDNLNTGTVIALTMDKYFDYFSWLGLEATSNYSNLSPEILTKINITHNQTELYYNKNCN